jgi:hypothetical protein
MVFTPLAKGSSWGSECRLDSVSSGQGLVLGSCEHSDDPSSSDATDLVQS